MQLLNTQPHNFILCLSIKFIKLQNLSYGIKRKKKKPIRQEGQGILIEKLIIIKLDEKLKMKKISRKGIELHKYLNLNGV